MRNGLLEYAESQAKLALGWDTGTWGILKDSANEVSMRSFPVDEKAGNGWINFSINYS